MAATALGFTRPDGREPALNASTLPAPWTRANASAIWLRFEFSTQTKSTRFTDTPPSMAPGCGSPTPMILAGPRRAASAKEGAESHAELHLHDLRHAVRRIGR